MRRNRTPCNSARPPKGAKSPRSALEAQVLAALEEQDRAREQLNAVLGPVLLRLAEHRFPVGTVLEGGLLSWLDRKDRRGTKVKIKSHQPLVSFNTPENSEILMECSTVRADGTELSDALRCVIPMLGTEYQFKWEPRSILAGRHTPAPRDRLMQLIREMEQATAPESGPTP